MMKRVLSSMLAIVIAVSLIAFVPPTKADASVYASQDVINYLKEMEGFSAIPYWDYGQWTVGFGNRCPDEHLERYKKEGIPVEEAHALFAQQLNAFVGQINTFMNKNGITLTQNQFDCLLCLTYNKGGGWMLMNNEPVVTAVKEKDMGNKFVAALSLTCYAGGGFLPGLMRRRLIEADMYLNGVYAREQKDNYCYVRYEGNGGYVSRSVQGYNIDLPVEFYSYATYPGHTFVGWFTEPEGGTQITKLDKSTDKMTLYAHWEEGSDAPPFEPVEVTITSYRINVRTEPGSKNELVGTIDRGEVVTVLEIREREGIPWGRIDIGWISLAYTDYTPPVQQPEIPDVPEQTDPTIPSTDPVIPTEPSIPDGSVDPSVPTEPSIPSEPPVPTEPSIPVEPTQPTQPSQPEPTQPSEPVEPEVPEIVLPPSQDPLPQGLPLTGKVVGTDALKVYNGPHTSYPVVKTLPVDYPIKIVETYELLGVLWGRLEEGGWVRTHKNILYDAYEAAAHPVVVNVTVWYLYVRSGPSTDFGWFHMVQKRDQLTITKLIVVDGDAWGLCQHGWVFLENTDFDLSQYAYYQNHEYGQWYHAKDPSCSQQGEERRDCSRCDHSDVIYTGYLPHEYGPWEDTREATCVLPGQQTRTCGTCGHQEVRNLELGDHSCGQWIQVSAPSCTDPGQERRDCQYCEYYESRLTARAEHTYGPWYETLTPTNTQTGLEQRDCSVCDHYEERVLPVTEHIYGQWQVQTPAACTQDGLEIRKCSHCDLVQQRAIPATGHTLGEWAVYQPASCNQAGSQRRICVNCQHYEERVLEMTGHTLGEWEVHTPATCTQDGQERRNCLHCDHYESKMIPAKGHTYGQWKIVTTPTYAQEGLERRDCTGCDEYETRALERLPGPQEKTYGVLTGSDFLYIRAGAGDGYPKVGSLKQGERVEIYEQLEINKVLWGRIDGGWICLTDMTLERFTVVAPSVVQKVYATVTTDVLNIRTGPGTNYEKVGRLYTGDRLEIFDQQMVGEQNWGRTERGWICLTEYTSLETVEVEVPPEQPEIPIPPEANPEVPDQPEDPPAEPLIKTYGVLTGFYYLNIRQGAGTGYPKLGTLSFGDKVEILEKKDVGGIIWGRIDRGWICLTDYMTLTTVTQQPGVGMPEKPSVQPEGDSGKRLFAIVTTNALSLRQGPGTQYFRFGFLYFGARLEVLEQKNVNGILWGRTNRGWICLTEYTRLEEVTEPDSIYMTVNTDVLNVRAGAGTDHAILMKLYMGEKLVILEETVIDNRAWVRVAQGWVCKEYLIPSD